MPTITLTGENDFARHRELKQLVDSFVKNEGDLSLEQLDGAETDYQRIDEALTSLPFLSSTKMVVLRNAAKNKQFVDEAERLLDNLPDTTTVILYEPKFDKRSSFYKLAKKKTDYREFAALDPAALQRWAGQEAKRLGSTLSAANARYLIERLGTNQQILASEIEKLSLAEDIDKQRIDLLTDASPQSTIFQLIDAAIRGDVRQALELYDEQRALKIEPQQIVAMFVWQLHSMALIKTAGQRTPDQIASQAKLNPYVVGKTATLARRKTLAEVMKNIEELLDIDKRSKREALDLDDALRQFILELAYQ